MRILCLTVLYFPDTPQSRALDQQPAHTPAFLLQSSQVRSRRDNHLTRSSAWQFRPPSISEFLAFRLFPSFLPQPKNSPNIPSTTRSDSGGAASGGSASASGRQKQLQTEQHSSNTININSKPPLPQLVVHRPSTSLSSIASSLGGVFRRGAGITEAHQQQQQQDRQQDSSEDRAEEIAETVSVQCTSDTLHPSSPTLPSPIHPHSVRCGHSRSLVSLREGQSRRRCKLALARLGLAARGSLHSGQAGGPT